MACWCVSVKGLFEALSQVSRGQTDELPCLYGKIKVFLYRDIITNAINHSALIWSDKITFYDEQNLSNFTVKSKQNFAQHIFSLL